MSFWSRKMSACKFFRNFLPSPLMSPKGNSSHQTREKEHQNHDLKVQKTQGAHFPAQGVERTREFQFPDNNSHRHRRKVSEDSPKTGLNQMMNQGNIIHLKLQVIGTESSSESSGRNFCSTEDNRREEVGTITSNRLSGSPQISKEIMNDSSAECGQTNPSNTELHTNVVSSVERASLQAVAGQMKHEKTEEGVMAPTDSCDKLFQDCVKKVNSSPKANDFEVTISDDECCSIVSSADTEIYEDTDYQAVEMEEEKTQEDIGKHEEGILEAIIKKYVLNLTALADVRFQFPSQIKSNEAQERANEEHLVSMNKSTARVYQLLNNSGLIETSNRPFQLKDSQMPEILNVITESSRSATTHSYSLLRGILNSTQQSSSDNLSDIVLSKSSVLIPGESTISNTMMTKSNEIESEDNSSSVDGIGYKDEVLSSAVSPSSTVTQALLPSNQAQEAEEVQSSSSLDEISYSGTSSSLMLPNLRHFPCNICNKSFKTKSDFVYHEKFHEKMELRKSFICNICKQAFRLPSALKQHMIIHEKPKVGSLHEEHIQWLNLKGLLNSLISSNDGHVGGNTGSDNFCNEDSSECEVTIVSESLRKNNTETIPRRSLRKDRSSKAVLGKRVSVATGVIYDDEVPSERSQSPTVTQALLSSDNSKAAYEDPTSFSQQANNDRGASSTLCSQKDSKETLQFPPGSTLVGHKGVYRMKDKERLFGCGYCGKTYKGRRAAYSHINQRHEKKHYQHSCEICGKRFSVSSYLAQHVRIHTQEKPFTCDECGKQFCFNSSLRSHKRTHSDERPYTCNKCNKTFKFSDHLSRHAESHKGEDQRKGLSCPICNRKLGKPSLLKQHMMIHTGEKPFKCTLCDKQYRLKINLRNHISTHSGKKVHAEKACSVCGKTFGDNYMSLHMRVHSGEKPFECNICGKRFPRKAYLEQHIRSHTGEKPFACSGCSKRFALYSNMVTHKAKCTTLSENVG